MSSSVAKSKGLYTYLLYLLAIKMSIVSISNADIIKDKFQVSRLNNKHIPVKCVIFQRFLTFIMKSFAFIM